MRISDEFFRKWSYRKRTDKFVLDRKNESLCFFVSTKEMKFSPKDSIPAGSFCAIHWEVQKIYYKARFTDHSVKFDKAIDMKTFKNIPSGVEWKTKPYENYYLARMVFTPGWRDSIGNVKFPANDWLDSKLYLKSKLRIVYEIITDELSWIGIQVHIHAQMNLPGINDQVHKILGSEVNINTHMLHIEDYFDAWTNFNAYVSGRFTREGTYITL